MRSVLVALSLIGLAAAGSASAGIETREVYVRINGPQLQRLMRSFGYKAELTTDRQGDPLIKSASGGSNFQVLFYTCNKARVRECLSIQFYSGYRMQKPPSIFKLNDWNAKWRYTRGFRSNTGAVRILADLSFIGGVTPASVRQALKVFVARNAAFRKYIGFQ